MVTFNFSRHLSFLKTLNVFALPRICVLIIIFWSVSGSRWTVVAILQDSTTAEGVKSRFPLNCPGLWTLKLFPLIPASRSVDPRCCLELKHHRSASRPRPYHTNPSDPWEKRCVGLETALQTNWCKTSEQYLCFWSFCSAASSQTHLKTQATETLNHMILWHHHYGSCDHLCTFVSLSSSFLHMTPFFFPHTNLKVFMFHSFVDWMDVVRSLIGWNRTWTLE